MGVQPTTDLQPELHTLVVGPLEVNSYVVVDPDSRDAVIIDPGAEAMRILTEMEALDARPVLILNTHTHGDHIGANETIKSAAMAPLAVHSLEAEYLMDPEANLSASLGMPVVSPPADILLEHGDRLLVGNLEVNVLHTPGHSPGSVSFLIGGSLFCGDVLFRRGIGRTDLPRGDAERLIDTIRREIFSLPEDTTVLPGHGPSTTVGEERATNPFLRE